jgi:AcrR family transcriptional regulator
MSIEERPLRADAERNRTRLLDAARTLFAERGLDVSMDDIAHEAGVGVGTAYRRFRSRDEIVAALFDERLGDVEARALAAVAHPDPWQGLVDFFFGSLHQQAENRGLKQLLFSSGQGRERVAQMRAKVLPIMERVLARAQDAGVVRSDVEVADLHMLSFMVGSVVDFAEPVDDEVWERYASLALDCLRPGSSTPLPRASLGTDQMESAMECWQPVSRRMNRSVQ